MFCVGLLDVGLMVCRPMPSQPFGYRAYFLSTFCLVCLLSVLAFCQYHFFCRWKVMSLFFDYFFIANSISLVPGFPSERRHSQCICIPSWHITQSSPSSFCGNYCPWLNENYFIFNSSFARVFCLKILNIFRKQLVFKSFSLIYIALRNIKKLSN